MICHRIFSNLALVISFQKSFQKSFKKSFKKMLRFLFLLWRRDPVLELQFLAPLRVVLLCFAIQSVQIAL